MNWFQFGAFIVLGLVFGGVLEHLLTVNRAMQAHLRAMAELADRQADALDRIVLELETARIERDRGTPDWD